LLIFVQLTIVKSYTNSVILDSSPENNIMSSGH